MKDNKGIELIYTYSDSVTGLQTFKAATLSKLLKHIAEIGYDCDKEGYIYENNRPILQYFNKKDGLTWLKAETPIAI